MNIDISNIIWEDTALDNTLPRSRLLAQLQLNGVNHHLEAIEVRSGASKFDQTAVCSRCDEILMRYGAVDTDDGPFNTVRIGEREYALFLAPFRY